MAGFSGSTKSTPSSVGSTYGVKSLDDTSNAEAVIPIGDATNSWTIRADPGNNGTVYVGWDEDVSSSNGFPLQAGDSLSVDIDNSEQELYAVPDNSGDEIRYIGID